MILVSCADDSIKAYADADFYDSDNSYTYTGTATSTIVSVASSSGESIVNGIGDGYSVNGPLLPKGQRD